MNNRYSLISKFIFIFIALTVININTSAASHEIGFGSYILKEKKNFNTDFGFNLHFDIRPNDFLVLRTAIAGIISKGRIGIPDIYWNAFYLDRESIADKPVLRDRFLILSIEKSILYRTTKGKFEPYAGIGIGIYSTKLAGTYYYYNESSKYSFGLNFCGGLKHPITSRWFSFFEVKQIISSLNIEPGNNRYPNISVESGLDIQDSSNISMSMNRLILNIGLSYRL